ncbi:MAG: sigma-70 family RNA polymerase sigma factor [Tannerellaceae bacterium]|jgi:RNA polymerase sigma factor (sigma-70 family)|nr:sigma-70 family RNA polymerase sigma factor [Tannerellaceae bacterium]
MTLKPNEKTEMPVRQTDMEQLIAEYHPKLRQFIRRKVMNRSDADDILQEVFFSFVKTVSFAVDPIEQVAAWLYRVARNTIINHGLRKREEEWPACAIDSEEEMAMELTDVLLEAGASPSPETDYLRSLLWSELEAALAELPPAQREIYELTELEGLPIKEIAAAAGLSVNTLRSRKHYAVLHLRKRLRRLYEDIVGA